MDRLLKSSAQRELLCVIVIFIVCCGLYSPVFQAKFLTSIIINFGCKVGFLKVDKYNSLPLEIYNLQILVPEHHVHPKIIIILMGIFVA